MDREAKDPFDLLDELEEELQIKAVDISPAMTQKAEVLLQENYPEHDIEVITAIKNTNSELYKDLFAKASEVLSGFERTQTFDENEEGLVNGDTNIEYNGTKITAGKISLDRNGKITIVKALEVNGYYCIMGANDKAQCTETKPEGY